MEWKHGDNGAQDYYEARDGGNLLTVFCNHGEGMYIAALTRKGEGPQLLNIMCKDAQKARYLAERAYRRA